MVGPLVTWGLLVAWLIHDLEEWWTMPAWSVRAPARLARRFPRLPVGLWSLLPISRAHATVAVGLVGILIAVAAADGARTDGRSALFQTVLIGFGAHSVIHIGQSIGYRGYTPGVITAPLVVAPYSWWAWTRLQDAGIADLGDGATLGYALLLFPPVVVGAHLIARATTFLVRRRRAL